MNKKCKDNKWEEKYYVLDKELSLVKLAHEKDLEAVETAREIQAREYERRLIILNGEAQHLRDIQATYLPRETWDNAFKEIKTQIEELKTFKNTMIGRQAVTAILIPTLISLGFLIINYIINRNT